MAEAICPLCGAVGGNKIYTSGKNISEGRGRSAVKLHTCTGCGLTFHPFYSFGAPVKALEHRIQELERKLADADQPD